MPKNTGRAITLDNDKKATKDLDIIWKIKLNSKFNRLCTYTVWCIKYVTCKPTKKIYILNRIMRRSHLAHFIYSCLYLLFTLCWSATFSSPKNYVRIYGWYKGMWRYQTCQTHLLNKFRKTKRIYCRGKYFYYTGILDICTRWKQYPIGMQHEPEYCSFLFEYIYYKRAYTLGNSFQN